MQKPDDPLSLVFRALADPTRRALIERLAHGEASVGELAAPFNMSGPAISQHLRVLEDAELITRTRRAQWRLCALTPEPLETATAWVEQHRRIWSHRFDALEEMLSTLQAADGPAPAAHDPAQDAAREMAQDPARDPTQHPTQDPTHDRAQDPTQDTEQGEAP